MEKHQYGTAKNTSCRSMGSLKLVLADCFYCFSKDLPINELFKQFIYLCHKLQSCLSHRNLKGLADYKKRIKITEIMLPSSAPAQAGNSTFQVNSSILSKARLFSKVTPLKKYH